MAVQTYSYSEIEPGLSGYFDDLENVTRRSFNDNACMILAITGTDATLEVESTGPEPYRVYVDGVYSLPAISAGEITLFTGLTDTTHYVTMSVNLGYATIWNWLTNTATEILTVTGDAPAMTPIPMSFVTWPSFTGISTIGEIAAPGGNITPTDPQATATDDGIGVVVVRSQCERIFVFTARDILRYSVDGGPIVEINAPDAIGERRAFLLDSGLDNTQSHDYFIYDVDNLNAHLQGVACVNNGAPATITAPSARASFYQYGDSITRGTNAAGDQAGYVDNFEVAIDIGAVTAKYGVGGQTTSELTLVVPSYFAESKIPDYVLLAIGRNDVGNANLQTDYTACIQAFLDEGCTNIICRGILPEGANTWGTENAAIQAAIASFSDPNIVFMDTVTWTGIETHDTVHPTPTGYEQIAAYEGPVLLALITPPVTYQVDGITYDSGGSILPSCRVSLFKHSGSGVYTYVENQLSDAVTGTYSFTGLNDNDSSYMVVAHLDGTPNVFDVSDNNLTPVES